MAVLGFEETNVSMPTVYQNYDGLLYVVPAKAGYNAKNIENLRLEFNLPTEYYPAHLPLYPFLISLFAPVLGFLKSMSDYSTKRVRDDLLEAACLYKKHYAGMFHDIPAKELLTQMPI